MKAKKKTHTATLLTRKSNPKSAKKKVARKNPRKVFRAQTVVKAGPVLKNPRDVLILNNGKRAIPVNAPLGWNIRDYGKVLASVLTEGKFRGSIQITKA